MYFFNCKHSITLIQHRMTDFKPMELNSYIYIYYSSVFQRWFTAVFRDNKKQTDCHPPASPTYYCSTARNSPWLSGISCNYQTNWIKVCIPVAVAANVLDYVCGLDVSSKNAQVDFPKNLCMIKWKGSQPLNLPTTMNIEEFVPVLLRQEIDVHTLVMLCTEHQFILSYFRTGQCRY